MNLSSKLGHFLCWIGVLALAAFLRFDDLSKRPFHFDEATGARITMQRISSETGYRFNPVHNHGPLLSAAAAPICRIKGEASWREMSKLSLRISTALAGTLLVGLPIFWRRRFGDVPMLAAAALLATSPLLVYFSRMFIHEMLLTLCGLAAVVLLCAKPRFSLTLKLAILGWLVGLMFATKETFAISIIAWTGAGMLLVLPTLLETRQHNTAENRNRIWREYRNPALAFFLVAFLTSLWCYTAGFTNFSGAWDAVRTFFIYKTGEGHDKPFGYYLAMLIIPSKGGIWWFETPVLILAAIAFFRTYLPGSKPGTETNIIRFLAFSAVFHVLIYSLIAYKTPWLMCLPWAHVCLLAGLSLRGVSQWKSFPKIIAVFLLLAVLFQQNRLSRFATGRFANDTRNPYAYAPTSGNIEALRTWMQQMAAELPPAALEPIGVVGSEYWPLPWYLRDFEHIGYWALPAPEVSDCPVVFALPEVSAEIDLQLGQTHTLLPRTLRSGVPVMMYLRNDLWEKWIAPETQRNDE